MVEQVDAVWLGDASGFGEDHFDLVAPGLRKGLPTFCDKPIGGTRGRHAEDPGVRREAQGPAHVVEPVPPRVGHGGGPAHARLAASSGRSSTSSPACRAATRPDGWMVYGQHPAWTVMTLLGPGVEAVSMYARENTCSRPGHLHGPDAGRDLVRPARRDADSTATRRCTSRRSATSTRRRSKAISGTAITTRCSAWPRTFREMVRTRKEPIPHQEILEVTAIVHAAARSLKEKSRLVETGGGDGVSTGRTGR